MMNYAENYHTELKTTVTDQLKKEVVAFANADGGVIYIGVDKMGQIVGVEQPEREMERISHMIRDGIKPDLVTFTSLRTISEAGKTIISLTVEQADNKPYYLTHKGLKPSGVYIRHGVTASPASEETIRQMIKQTDGTTYELMRSLEQQLTFDSLHAEFYQRNLSLTAQNMLSLKLKNASGFYTNLALLLSDQCRHTIKCAVYDTARQTFKARREFSGSLLKQVDASYQFIELNNDLSSEFSGLRRSDRYSYPETAIRELLINAVVHRDYSYSGSTIINIYHDHIEFVSIGGLVRGLTLEDVLNGVSQSRNSYLMNILYRLELIESYGTGLKKVRHSYQDSIEQPTLKAGPASFVATLPSQSPAIVSEKLQNYGMTAEERVLKLIRQRGEISRRDVEALLGTSSFPAHRVLNALLEKGAIERIGRARATTYILNRGDT